MRHFVLRDDERVTDRPYPLDFHTKIDVREAKAQGRIARVTPVKIVPSEFTVLPEVVCRPVTLVTREVRDVIKAFEPYIAYREVAYLDQENEIMQAYLLPMLPEVDCLSEQTEYVNDRRAAFSKIVLKPKEISGRSLFLVKNGIARLVIIRLDLAESLLSRNYKGFTLTEAAVEQ